MSVNIDTNEVVTSLSNQIGALSRDIAVLNAIVKAQTDRIQELEAKTAEQSA